MRLVLLSNSFNEHQKCLSDAFFSHLGDSFTFIATTPLGVDRIKCGWQVLKRPYLIPSYEGKDEYNAAIKRINGSDIVVWGAAPISMVQERLKAGKLTFRYSERVYKTAPPLYEMPLRAVKYFWQFGRHKNLHLLCASAYTAGDYARTRTFLGKAYKWGYFPEVKRYDNVSALIAKKKKNSILWVARFLSLKHPEAPVEVAKRLAADGYEFELNMIGVGAELEKTKALVAAEGLGDRVHFLGSMKPEEVREYMEKSEIYLFTSDRGEGWGAVLNESMNSACAVVASHAIGSVPFLVKDTENGLIYRDGDIDDLYSKVKWLLENSGERIRLGEAAYRTMIEQWNAENAAKRFLALAEAMLAGDRHPSLFEDGVCSKAENFGDNWYK